MFIAFPQDGHLCQHYQIRKVIEHTKIGAVCKGEDIITKKEVAIKHEKHKDTSKRYTREIYALKATAGAVGFPLLYDNFSDTNNSYIMMELTGLSLERCLKANKEPFSLKTVLMIADQMVSRIQFLHSKGIIHRDIKPHNMAVGLSNHFNQIYLLDFGLSKLYIDFETGTHKAMSYSANFSGTTKFASLNFLRGMPQSRRDDLESLMYSLVYMLKGSLPWDGDSTNLGIIASSKAAVPTEVLCEGLPSEFTIITNYIKNLDYDECPDYSLIRKTFRNLFIERGYIYDGRFDWMMRKKQTAAETPPPVIKKGHSTCTLQLRPIKLTKSSKL